MIEFADEVGDPIPDTCCWKDVDTYHFFGGWDNALWKQIANDSYFWMNLKRMPRVRHTMITNGIWPDMYLTARPVGSHITGQWIQKEMLPVAGVITVDRPEDKMEHLRPGDVFVDDHPKTVRMAQEMGVKAILMRAPFHRGVDAAELEGLAAISCLSEIVSLINNQH